MTAEQYRVVADYREGVTCAGDPQSLQAATALFDQASGAVADGDRLSVLAETEYQKRAER